jgi:hypothetical protein
MNSGKFHIPNCLGSQQRLRTWRPFWQDEDKDKDKDKGKCQNMCSL